MSRQVLGIFSEDPTSRDTAAAIVKPETFSLSNDLFNQTQNLTDIGFFGMLVGKRRQLQFKDFNAHSSFNTTHLNYTRRGLAY